MYTKKKDPLIHGFVKPGFEQVLNQFEKNFTQRGEIGAACAIYAHGELVVDLWGGYRDEVSRSTWEKNTLVIVSSTTKGLAAMAVALAYSRGWLDLDEKVAVYWPEFAQQGKQDITVRMLMAHQAGLCVLDNPLSFDEASDLDRLAEILERQKPAWKPGTRQGYHAITLGWYMGELIRRADPLHRSLGRFFQEEIAIPLGLDFYIGLPSEIPDTQIATVKEFGLSEMLSGINYMPWQTTLGFLSPNSLTKRSFQTPTPALEDKSKQRREFLAIEGPAYNGVGTARSIARAYGMLAAGGKELGFTPKALEAFIQPALPPSAGGLDLVLKIEISFSLGCCKPGPTFRFGTNNCAFGMPGMGGSIGYADPDLQVGFGYTPNKWAFRLLDDPRPQALRSAFHRCIASSQA